MSQNTNTPNKAKDTILWILVSVLVASGIVGNYLYSNQSALIRTVCLLALAAIAIVSALKTFQGKRFWNFAIAARMETRKVVWPTRPETVQTTMMVMGMVIVMGLILWGVDAILLKAVAWLTGYGAV